MTNANAFFLPERSIAHCTCTVSQWSLNNADRSSSLALKGRFPTYKRAPSGFLRRGFSSRGASASRTPILLPLIFCPSKSAIAASAISFFSNVINPNPRRFPASSLINAKSVTLPCFLNMSRTWSSSTSLESPPTNNLHPGAAFCLRPRPPP